VGRGDHVYVNVLIRNASCDKIGAGLPESRREAPTEEGR